jgi:hypothetical protein
MPWVGFVGHVPRALASSTNSRANSRNALARPTITKVFHREPVLNMRAAGLGGFLKKALALCRPTRDTYGLYEFDPRAGESARRCGSFTTWAACSRQRELFCVKSRKPLGTTTSPSRFHHPQASMSEARLSFKRTRASHEQFPPLTTNAPETGIEIAYVLVVRSLVEAARLPKAQGRERRQVIWSG